MKWDEDLEQIAKQNIYEKVGRLEAKGLTLKWTLEHGVFHLDCNDIKVGVNLAQACESIELPLSAVHGIELGITSTCDALTREIFKRFMGN